MRHNLLLVGIGMLLVLLATPAAALTAVAEVSEDPYYTQNRSNFYGNTSLTNFYAPLPVFFEGWKSTPREQITSYLWDFGDGSPPMSGFNAAHVYETPGNYTATLTITGQGGATATATIPINVRPRDGTTYYVDAVTGNDGNSGTSPQQAWRTASHALKGLSNAISRYHAGDQILFRRGQTFEFTGNVEIGHSKRYGIMFAAFGEGPRPIIQFQGNSGGQNMFNKHGSGHAHLTLADLDFRCLTPNGGERTGFWFSGGFTNQILFLRCHAQDFGGGFIFSHGKTTNNASGMFIVDCTTLGSTSHHIYANVSRLALLNNHFDLSGNHLAYIEWLNKGVIQGNLFTRNPFGRTCLRIAGNDGFDNPSNNVWIENNYFTGWIDPVTSGVSHGDGTRYNFDIVHLGPNTSTEQSMVDIVFQNNTIVDGEKLLAIGSYERLKVRNNLMWTHTPWTEGHIFFGSQHGFDKRPLKDIEVYDNILIKDAPPENAGARMLQVRPYTASPYQGQTSHEDIVFRNNVSHMSGGRTIWFQNMDMAIVNGFHSNNNRYYTTAPQLLAGRDNTNYDMAGWRALSGNDMQSSVFNASVLPATGTASAPAEVTSGAIPVSYSGATDPSGSGVKQVHLWARKDRGSWIRTPFTSTGSSGTIQFTPWMGNGTYYFWVQTENNAGHMSLPKTVPSPYPNMSGRRTLSPHGDAATIYGGGVHSPPPPPKDEDPDPDPEPPPADTTPPTPGTLTAPANSQTSPIQMSYSGASDNTGGSGLNKVMLYARKSDGNWAYTGQESSGANGSFSYPAPSEGTFHFSTVAIDNAGNQSPAPSGTGMATTVFSLPPPPSEGLVSHLRFDDPPGDGALDSARPGVNVPVSGSVTAAAGQIDGSYNFNNGYVNLGNMDVQGAGLTLAVWINPSSFVGWSRDGRILGKANGIDTEAHWWMLSTIRESDTVTRVRFRLKTQGGNTNTLIGGSGNIPLNTWTHVAATFDGTNMRIYVNGELNGTQGKVGTLAQNASVPVWVGNTPVTNDKPWAGRIDDARIYNYALSQAEIQSIMNPSDPGPGQDTTPPTPGTLTAPSSASSAPITVQFSGAADNTGGSGLASVRLFYRVGGGAWADSGLTSSAASGSFQFNAVSTDGPYHFHTVATDNAGNSSAAPSGNGMATTMYDANGPILGGMTASTAQTNSGPVTLNYTGITDASGVQSVALWVQPPGGNWGNTGQTSSNSPSGSFSFNGFSGDGTYRFAVSATDTLGNSSSAASGNGLVSVVYDATAPSVGGLSGPTSSSGSPVTLNYAGVSDSTSGIASVQLWARPPGGSWSNTGTQSASAPSGSFSYGTFSASGQYAFAIRALDKAGNASPTPSGSGMHTITYDNTPPSTGALSGPTTAKSGPISLSYSGVTDAASGVKSVQLWARRPNLGWAYTGQQSTSSPSGSFSYSPASGDGTYNFALLVEDNAGNKTSTPSGGGQHTLTYDTTAPTTGSLTGPSTAKQGPVTLNYSGVNDVTSSVASVQLWVRPPNGSWTNTGQQSTSSPSGSFSFNNFAAEGSYAFALRTTDTAENISPTPSGNGQFQLTFDNTPPASGTLTGPEFANAAPVTISYSGVTDTNTVTSVRLWARTPGGSWADTGQVTSSAPSGSFSYGNLSTQGKYAFAIRAEDQAGNVSPVPTGDGAYQLTFDTTAPSTGTLTVPQQANSAPVNVSFSNITDQHSGVHRVTLWVRPPGGSWGATTHFIEDTTSGSFAFSGFSGEGTYRFALRTRDKAGNQSPTPSGNGQASLLFDNTPPTAPVIEAPAQTNTTPITIAYTGAQDTSGGSGLKSVLLFVRQGAGAWNDTGQTQTAASGSFQFTPTAEATYRFHLVAEDNLGNRSAEPSGNGMAQTIYDTTPPAVGSLTGPTGANSGPVSFSYSGVTDARSGVDRVALWVRRPDANWQDSGVFSAQSPSGTLNFNAFSGPGTYRFALVATDKAGNASATPTGNGQATLVFDNTPPPSPQLEGPQYATSTPIALSYSGAVDEPGGSGIKEVRLFFRRSGQANWTNTGLTGPGGSGSLSFANATQDGIYHFHLVSVDQQDNESAAPSGSGMATTIFDTTAPATGSLAGPPSVNAGPISLNYAGVTDAGSGVDEVRLWVRPPDAAWANTGMTSSAAPSGSFSFNAFSDEGSYAFALQVVDQAGNTSAAPTGTGQLQVAYDVTAPEPTSLSSPAYANDTPIPVSYTASSATPIAEARLFYRRSQDSIWSDSGLTRTTAAGEFPFTNVTSNGTYHFALVVTDTNGNSSPAPAPGSPGLDSTVYDRSPPNRGSLSGPTAKGDGPLVIEYSGVTDIGGSTIDLITLWMRPPGGGWSTTGITSTAAPSGSLEFDNFGADGAYHFDLMVRDKAGNETDAPTGTGSLTYQHDTTAPTLPTLTVNPYVSSAPIVVSYSGAADSGSGLAEVELWVRPEGQSWVSTSLTQTGASGEFAFSALGSDGTYAFSVRARDNAGNATPFPTGNGLAQTVLDRAAPAPASVTVAEFSNSSPIQVSYSGASDSASGLERVHLWARKGFEAWQETGVTATGASGAFSFDGIDGDAIYRFYAQVEDRAGNRSPEPTGVGSASTNYDATAPTKGTLESAAADTNTSPIELTYSGIVEVGSGLDSVVLFVKRGTGSWQSTELTATTPSGFFSYPADSDGTFHFDLRVRDKAGNESPMPSGDGQVTVQFDGAPPTVGPLTAPEFAKESPVTIGYSGVTDGDGGSGLKEVELYVKKNSGAWVATGHKQTEASGSFEYPVTTGDGTYYFAVRAEDNAGNRSPVPAGNGAATTVYDATAPNPGTATAVKFTNNATIAVQHSGATDATSGIASVQLWARPAGGAWAPVEGATSTGASGSLSFTAPSPGSYGFALRATDKAGNESPQPTTASATTVYDTTAPTLGTLSAPAKDDGPPISVLYSGVTDQGGSGLATVTLWVRKGSGSWQSTNMSSDKASGSFGYQGMDGNDTYYFSLVAEDRAGNRTPNPTGDGMGQTEYNADFTAGVAQSPEFATALPIVVTYSGAEDSVNGGEVMVSLWAKVGADAEWVNTGLQTMGSSGEFEFEDAVEDGVYHFALQAMNSQDELTSEPFGSGDTTTIFDTTPPTALEWNSPATTNTLPIEVDYTGVYDAGSGVKQVHLWVRQGTDGEWLDTGEIAEGDEGVFYFDDAPADDNYYFYIQAEDNAGLLSPSPLEAKEDMLEPTSDGISLLESPGALTDGTPIEGLVTIPGDGGLYQLTIQASGNALGDTWPSVRLSVNGEQRGNPRVIDSSTPQTTVFSVPLESGVHSVGIVLINPGSGPEGTPSVALERMDLHSLADSPAPIAGAPTE